MTYENGNTKFEDMRGEKSGPGKGERKTKIKR
jgi:hypothetical protein